MFDRFRKPIRKPQSYRLQLTPLEVRDVPATWHVEATSAAGYRNHFLMTSAIALLPLPERGGEKMDLLGCLESYGVLAKKAMPYAITSIYNESEGVQVSAIWLLRAFEHHSIRAVPKLLALSLAKPREYSGQEAYKASVSIIRSWISYVLHGADLGELKAQKPNPNMANLLLKDVASECEFHDEY